MEAVEKNIAFDENGNALISLGIKFSQKNAKVLVLFNEEDEINEQEWLKLAKYGGAFNFLNDSSEDIYSDKDGTPYKRK